MCYRAILPTTAKNIKKFSVKSAEVPTDEKKETDKKIAG